MNMARKTLMMQELENNLCALAIDPNQMIDATRHLLGLYGRLTWIAELGDSTGYNHDALDSALQLYDNLMGGGKAPELVSHSGAESLCDVMRQVLDIIARYPQNGPQYHYILKSAYFDPAPQPDVILMDNLHLERTTYYSRKREAVTLFATLLHTKYIPQLHQTLHWWSFLLPTCTAYASFYVEGGGPLAVEDGELVIS